MSNDMDKLQKRVRLIREIAPDAAIYLIEPCLRCGLNLWDRNHHTEQFECLYPRPEHGTADERADYAATREMIMDGE